MSRVSVRYISILIGLAHTSTVDICGNESAGLFSYVQIGQSSGVLSLVNPSLAGGVVLTNLPTSVATITVNHGTTVVITSLVPSEPTITVNTTANPTSANQSDDILSSDRLSLWDSAGKVAGVFIAVGIVAALFVIGFVWLCRNANGRPDEEKSGVTTSQAMEQQNGSQPVSRSASSLQLLGKREPTGQEAIPSPSSNANYRLSLSPTELVVPVVDQRLDPQSMMIRFEDNDSRTSFRDEEDYSRRIWRVTNASDSDSLRSGEADQQQI